MPVEDPENESDDRDPLHWGSVEDIISTIKFDFADARVLVTGPWGGKGDYVQQAFDDVDELHELLHEIAPSGIVENALSEYGVYEFFSTHKPAASADTLLLDVPATEARAAERIVQAVSDELIRYLAAHPEKMRELHPRKFEELVAELFKDMGYEVELTTYSNDGGRDILALRKDAATTFLTHVECKRYAEHRHVGVGVVRQLFGVVEKERASHGVIATTTFFTKGAQAEAKNFHHRLSLKDYTAVVAWLRGYKKGNR